MAFKFTWPTFSGPFYETASNLLTSALSKAPTPPIITDNIVVKEFNLGTAAPELEMLEIGELGEDKFRGVFKLKYSGDAYIVLQTKVQVNRSAFIRILSYTDIISRRTHSTREAVLHHHLPREASSLPTRLSPSQCSYGYPNFSYQE